MKAFLVGLLAGVVAGFSMFILGTLTVFVGVPLLVIGVFIPPRLLGAAGTLIGLGATWLVVFGPVATTCRPPDCSTGGSGETAFATVGPWLAVAAACLVAGLVLLVIGLARRSRSRRPR